MSKASSPAQYEHHLVSELPCIFGGYPIVMLSGYLDDSADPKGERYAAYGGVLGLKNQMEMFELLWLHETHELTEPFRSTDCENGFAQFSDPKKWPHAKRIALMTKLVSRIKEQNVWSYGTTTSVKDYRLTFPRCAPRDPLMLCAASSIIGLGVLAKSINHPIKIEVEHGDHDMEIHRIFYALKAIKPWGGQSQLLSIGFSPKTLVPLQAADLMARETFKHFDNEGVRPMRKPLVRLSKQMMLHKWRPDGLRNIRDLGYPHDLERFTSTLIGSILQS